MVKKFAMSNNVIFYLEYYLVVERNDIIADRTYLLQKIHDKHVGGNGQEAINFLSHRQITDEEKSHEKNAVISKTSERWQNKAGFF